MARGGRPRKSGPRLPCGKLRPPTLAQIKLADERARLRETAVVARQPHRCGTADPSHPWAGTALGRLLLPQLKNAPRETQLLFDAAGRWRQMCRRSWWARGVADPNRGEEAERQAPAGPDLSPEERDERTRARKARVDMIRGALVAASPAGFAALQDAALFEIDVPPAVAGEVVRALGRLALELRLTGAQRAA